MSLDIGAVDHASPHQVGQQSVPQPNVGLRRQGQVQIGPLGCVRAAGIDHHMALTARTGGLQPAEQDGMRPGGVVSGEDHQIGEVQVLIASRHQVSAERQFVRHDGRGHAKPRVGVDVPRADKALHQLVGRVVVLGQQLAGNVERHRIWTVLGHGLCEAVGDQGGRLGPGRTLPAYLRIEQPPFQPDRRSQR